MFGIKKKVYYIIALICAVGGIVVLALKVFGLVPKDSMYTLISLILMLLAFVFYLRPALKKLKLVNTYSSEYRSVLYTFITKDSSREKIDITELEFVENDLHQLTFTSKKTNEVMTFDTLSFVDATAIMLALVRDFVMICYGESKANKKKIDKASIPSFIVKVKKIDGKEITYHLIKDYQYTIKDNHFMG